MLVPPEGSSAVLVIVSSESVSICNRSHARRVNSGKITISSGVPLFDALVRGESPHPAARNLVTKKTRDSTLLHGQNRRLYLTWTWFGTGLCRTDRETDRITIASTHLVQANLTLFACETQLILLNDI